MAWGLRRPSEYVVVLHHLRFASIFTGLALLLGASQVHALFINGREVEDVYEYILDNLAEDARIQEEYRLQVERDPNFRGIRPYTFSSLSHLSVEDLVYGAAQGGLAAVRDAGPNATREEVIAQCEANIQRIMELFPMLTKDFTAANVLLQRMIVPARKDYMQEFLLKRCRPGRANESLFTLFWQEELQRNHQGYVRALSAICDDIYTTAEPLQLALELYVQVSEDDYLAAFNKDAGIAALRAQGHEELTPVRALSDESLQSQMANPDDLLRQTRKLVPVRKRLLAQLDPTMQRDDALKEFATRLLAAFDEAHPTVEKMQDEEPEPAAPPAMPFVEGEMASPEEAPADTETPTGFPKIGIPTLKGF
jgi:hypothetical protein